MSLTSINMTADRCFKDKTEIETLTAGVFAEMDQNCDGNVDLEKMKDYYMSIIIYFEPARARDAIRFFDNNPVGFTNLAEFTKVWLS